LKWLQQEALDPTCKVERWTKDGPGEGFCEYDLRRMEVGIIPSSLQEVQGLGLLVRQYHQFLTNTLAKHY
jgi:hypothetical protein